MIDEINLKLLQLIEQHGRMSHEELAKRLHVSRPTVHDRIHKLEAEGYIKGYQGIVDWGKLGETIKAFVFIKTQGVDCQETASKLSHISIEHVTLEEFHRLAGPWCYSIKIRSRSPGDLTRFIDTARKLPGIVETNTIFILDTAIENSRKEASYVK